MLLPTFGFAHRPQAFRRVAYSEAFRSGVRSDSSGKM
jgi:hypothetical protein